MMLDQSYFDELKRIKTWVHMCPAEAAERIIDTEAKVKELEAEVSRLQGIVKHSSLQGEKIQRYESALKEIADHEEPRYQNEYAGYYFLTNHTVKQALVDK